MNEIDKIQLAISYWGPITKQKGHYIYLGCPLCNDSHKDNLVGDTKNNTLWCYGNNTHAPQLLSEMLRKTGNSSFLIKPELKTISKNIQTEVTPEKKLEYLNYQIACTDELINNQKALDFLREQRGITKDTVEFCGIGIDYTKKRWVFPTYKYIIDIAVSIVGFEYRPLNLSKKWLYREKDSKTCMAMINNYTPAVEVLVIIEGYIDGYVFLQYLRELNQESKYHIVTPSNGVSGILTLIDGIIDSLSKYKRIYVYLDSDKVSKPKMDEIIAKYPVIRKYEMNCGCKDFNEHYLKCIMKNKLRKVKK